MGSSVNSASVLFCLKGISVGSAFDPMPNNTPSIFEPYFSNSEEITATKEYKGWRLLEANVSYKRVWVDLYGKGIHRIYVINESELAVVSEVELSVFSSDLDSLETFKKDFNIDTKIDNPESVVQFL